jgi:hypothetical protein
MRPAEVGVVLGVLGRHLELGFQVRLDAGFVRGGWGIVGADVEVVGGVGGWEAAWSWR